MEKERNEAKIKPIHNTELPPEFTRFDAPLGLEQHVIQSLYIGIILHVGGLYYIFYLWLFGHVPRLTLLYWIFGSYVGGIGVAAGAHRLWTHRTYKAKLPLQIMLMLMQTSAMQYPIFKWARDHRAHHKYTDTNGDPHNASRGFWFSHMFWLFQPKHPELVDALNTVDISDLAWDPLLRFQSKYYWELILVVYYAIPMYIGHVLFPGLSLFQLFCGNLARHLILLQVSFTVNSVLHLWGYKPFDKNISSTDNKAMSILTIGEGSHNYHHIFPWDYSTPEVGFKPNLSTLFIQFFAWIGWAYDLKTVSRKTLFDRINRTGDGSYEQLYGETTKNTEQKSASGDENLITSCWGWGDDQISKQKLEVTEILFPSKSRRE